MTVCMFRAIEELKDMGFKVLHKLENWFGTCGAGAVSVIGQECLKMDI